MSDSPMSIDDKDELRKILERIHFIMRSEGESNWIRGIALLIRVLEESDGVRKVRASYKHMMGGNGSFSDYYIHRDDFEERRAANKELNELRDRLWDGLFPQSEL